LFAVVVVVWQLVGKRHLEQMDELIEIIDPHLLLEKCN
jgi:hypothetical protein